MQDEKKDIEKLLAEGKVIQIHPNGYSMYPMFVSGRDEAVIRQAETARLRRGDVVLYRRESGILVLHRIWKRKGEVFFMVGDNQTEVEGPLRETQIKGVLTAFIRKGKYISVTHPVYRSASRIWLFLRPVRHPIMNVGAWAKKIKKYFYKSR